MTWEEYVRNTIDCGCCPVDEEIVTKIAIWIATRYDAPGEPGDADEAASAYYYAVWEKAIKS
jgi:hypothetical protein